MYENVRKSEALQMESNIRAEQTQPQRLSLKTKIAANLSLSKIAKIQWD